MFSPADDTHNADCMTYKNSGFYNNFMKKSSGMTN